MSLSNHYKPNNRIIYELYLVIYKPYHHSSSTDGIGFWMRYLHGGFKKISHHTLPIFSKTHNLTNRGQTCDQRDLENKKNHPLVTPYHNQL